jgi:outer membrane protein assembly factor BamE (lipoprotein component of BamABCDE complex)
MTTSRANFNNRANFIRTIFTFVIVSATLISFSFQSCMTPQDHANQVRNTTDKDLTVGQVQRSIKKGMSGADVAEALGSPNIVTKDADGNETWVYDKIATEVTYSQSQSAWFVIFGGEARQGGAVSSTQRTLTVVVKYDANSRVNSVSYHSSKF